MLLPLLVLIASPALAGGGPMNVLVVYNADDPDAVGLTEAYAQARSVPEAQLCGLSGVDPTADAMGHEGYISLVLEPVMACLAALPQPEEIHFLTLIKGLPYRVDLPAYSVSLDAALQILDTRASLGATRLAGQAQARGDGYYYASIPNPVVATTSGYSQDFTLENPYMGWYVSASGLTREATWPAAHDRMAVGPDGGWDFEGNLFAVGRLDGFTYEDAAALIERALLAEQARPEGEWLCMQSADSARGARDPECELTTRRLAGQGLDATWLEPHDANLEGREVVAYFTGAAGLTGAIDGQTYAPGAVVDNLTSYGAVPNNFRCSEDGATCPANESQTSIARFVRAGATAVHGTVAEPLNNVFPNAAALLFYANGYSLGESWLYSTWHLYWQNIWLGDPLLTPWAERPVVSAPETLPEGELLTLSAPHPDGVAELILYIDGARVAAAEGDSLSVELQATEGESLDLMVVAVAENAPFTPTDWPVAEVLPQPSVQGWAHGTLTLTEALPDEDTAVLDSGLDDPKTSGRCASTTGTSGAPSLLLALALLLARRRDRRPAPR
ncbi:MAG: hypothetical protein H6740_17270 [Alphaproteobacteria bacterium]|nr:hypothetical protein [Alphaproteobacteria bacterium]